MGTQFPKQVGRVYSFYLSLISKPKNAWLEFPTHCPLTHRYFGGAMEAAAKLTVHFSYIF